MEFSSGAGGGSGDEQEVSMPNRRGKKSYHRHTARQINQLEEFFKRCPHPDESQRGQLSRELGLEPKQIKFWFQNKRTQAKTQNERADNSVLRAENEKIYGENIAIREALKNVMCPDCGGPPFGEENRRRSLINLQIENAQLKEEHLKLYNLITKLTGKPPVFESSALGEPSEFPTTSLSTPRIGSSSVNIDLNVVHHPENFQTEKGVSEVEKALMSDAATTAVEELLMLIRVTEPMWVETSGDGRLVIDRDTYERMFPREYHFKGVNARIESSKYSEIMPMEAAMLVDIFLDPYKWVDLFPTLLTEARTILVLDEGAMGSRNGSLQLMYEQMHILSPLVPQRDFSFLRACRQVDVGTWVIADVSYDFLKEDVSQSRCWRLPSGCLFQDLFNGFTRITWVEHVEVDDKIQTHKLYRDLICGGSAYGAERWIGALHRVCERLIYFAGENVPIRQTRAAMITSESRRTLMKLTHRMMKNFCATLGMANKVDFPQLSEMNNGGVHISVRESNDIGEPNGTIVNAATSFWIPLQPDVVFTFFSDEVTRFQWDILSNSSPIHEIARIATGVDQGNFISIMRPYIPSENHILILQECYTDKYSSMLVYAPIDIQAMNFAINGEETSEIPILSSGIVISGDGRPESGTSNPNAGTPSGTLLTVAYQILIAITSKERNMDSLATVNTLISSTAQKIRDIFNCSPEG